MSLPFPILLSRKRHQVQHELQLACALFPVTLLPCGDDVSDVSQHLPGITVTNTPTPSPPTHQGYNWDLVRKEIDFEDLTVGVDKMIIRLLRRGCFSGLTRHVR